MSTEEKLDKILGSITDLKVEVARSLVHQENHAIFIKDLQDYKDKDKAMKNKFIGGFAVFNTALIGLGHWITKNF